MKSEMDLTSIEYSNVSTLTWMQKLSGQPNSRQNQRTIVPFKQDNQLPTNQIHTCKYTPYNFIPKNLFEQLTKPSNLYFLIIGIFQILPYTTLTGGIPIIYLPLGIITLISALKDLYEDHKRSVSDEEENNGEYVRVANGFVDLDEKVLAKDIKVGMVVKVMKDQQVPMDGLVIRASSDIVYLSTKNLDGQTNLKRRKVLKYSQSTGAMREQVVSQSQNVPNFLPFMITYDPPSSQMKFRGRVHFQPEGQVQVNMDYMCLRGSQLQNTEYVYLLALYTGHDTKVLLSMNNPSSKKSTIERKLIKLIIMIFCTIVLLAIIMSVLKLKTRNNNRFLREVEPGAGFIISVFSWILNLTNLVPISLIVTLQSVKLIEGKIITFDKNMANKDFASTVNCSNVLQDLGTIEFIASDKTGTLTKNKLTLRQISDGLQLFTVQNLKQMPAHLRQLLCTCHQAYVNHQGQYQSQSQDQTCILQFCSERGCKVINRTDEQIELEMHGSKKNYKLMQIIEFTSERKSQSVIYKDQDGKVYLVMKGADEKVKEKLRDVGTVRTRKVLEDLDGFAGKGYRTLLMASKELQAVETEQWIVKYKEAKEKSDRDLMKELEGEIECDLITACAIGIEDELQDQVPETIRTIIEAGIRFVIISGDKKETVLAIARNIKIEDEPVVAEENIYDPELYRDKKLVVFARCSPREKEKIVSAMQGRVLAIGDGANDVSMITKATIGVGIAGKQGKAAVQAADFGIPEFKYLRRLMFYYGRELYRKNAQLVKYNFYKNFLYTFPQVTFAFFSGYTGVSIYQAYLSQLYNLLFTSLPIMIYALCDEAEQQKDLLQNKDNMYAVSKKQIYFGNCRIFFYLVQAVILGFISSYLCFLLTPLMYRSPNDLNLYQISSILMLYVVVYANLRVLFMERYLNMMVFVSVIIGICLYFAAFRAILWFSPVIERSISIIFLRKTGIIIFVCVLASLIATLLFETILNYIYHVEEVAVEIDQHKEVRESLPEIKAQ